MCRGSPGSGIRLNWSRPRPTAGTRTVSEQLLEGVDAGRVTVAPLDPESVGADQLQRKGPNIGRHAGGVKQRPATHLLDATGAGTGKSERTR